MLCFIFQIYSFKSLLLLSCVDLFSLCKCQNRFDSNSLNFISIFEKCGYIESFVLSDGQNGEQFVYLFLPALNTKRIIMILLSRQSLGSIYTLRFNHISFARFHSGHVRPTHCSAKSVVAMSFWHFRCFGAYPSRQP